MTPVPGDSMSVPRNDNSISSKLDFPVVGIGASAGGLKALQRFLEQMPKDNGMAFVVILHLSPDHESSAAQVLQRATRMKVLQVTEPVPIEKHHVYVIPPGKDLSMNDGYLRLTDPPARRGQHTSIDLFFRTLADVHKERAFCIVLSGNGSDGTVGLARIKEQGGVTMAQTPEDAEYEGMPRSAIETGLVDMVLPVTDMPQKLTELWQNLRNIALPDYPQEDSAIQIHGVETKEQAQAAERALRDVINLLRNRTGHDFRHYKRATVLRRIERRMQVNAKQSLPAYLDYLLENNGETHALLGDMLIGVTNFFRDREAFEALERDIIPLLFEENTDEEREIRVWSAGCSTGQEAYSLAMLLSDQAELDGRPAKLQVFATDIDERAIAVGRAGIFPEAIITDVTPTRLRQFFTKEQTYYRIKKEIREKMLFAQHSLLRDPPFSKLDLISCRNLLIYLDRDVQHDILRMFHFALRPGGYLFLGSSESADACADLFTVIDKKNRIYRARTDIGITRPTPVVPTEGFQLAPTVMKTTSYERRKVSFAEVHRRVLEQYAPPSVIVNHESEIVHMSDRAGHFLRYVGGEPSHNLLTLVHPELRLELRTALFQAIQSRMSVEARRVRLARDGRTFYVNMVARPFTDGEAGSELVLVLFDEVEETMSNEAKSPRDDGKDSVLSHLEEELQRTKQQLQATIEQSETSTEELKASNEELQAINEELRSTTEELETSKEDLQSINEELITVNHELKSKVEETGKINDDLQNLITSADIATVFVDRGLRIKWYTPRAVDIFSIIPTDAGRSLLDITHRLYYDELAEDTSRVFESLRLIEREVQSTDGAWYIVRLLPYRTTEDRIEGAVLTFFDISRRREAEEQLRAGEELMRLVAESTRDYAIITLDTEGLITSWNKGAEINFGYLEQEALGQPGALIFTPEDIEAGVPQQEMLKSRENGRAEDERWHQRKDGSRFYCSGIMTPLVGQRQGYVKIARDLTEHKRQLMQQESQLNESKNSSQLKDEFFAIMSHELKHPLNLIQLHAELLSRLPAVKSSGLMSKAAHTIQQAVQSQARIIDDLLDLSRVRTGKLKLKSTPVDLRQLIDDIGKVAQAEAAARDIAFSVRHGADGEPMIIEADFTRVEQIVWNLVNNALKFTLNGGHVTLLTDLDGGMARLQVIDDGQGIDQDFLPKVFELFGQGEGQHAQRNRDGLGIGLSLVRQLAEAHGGRVAVTSAGRQRGSTFSVWLPLYTLPHALAADKGAVEGGKLRNLRILLVDDSPDILETLQMLLEMEEARVTTATSGEKALALADTQTFDLILSDIGMPNMDGHALIRALRQLPQCAGVPAIALTGYGTSDDAQKTLDAGFNQHIGKPVAYDALIATIEKLLH
ncbi:chemotaxis protein CheB [Pseudomonas sp. UBA6310]|uniref:chemotaxis protein CheB n=1 Tax=Pseudomonas sp. UBA6310 TaxID=1947327 RepID=UPI0039C94676